MRERAQLSLSLVEAGVGIVLVFAVASGFLLGTAPPDTRGPQLDAYAGDVATVLATEPPRHRGATRLSEVARSPAAFDRERAALERRVERLLPDNLMYQIETRHGVVGFRQPGTAVVGVATVATTTGDVTVRVWYA
jgi:hypothetical protein